MCGRYVIAYDPATLVHGFSVTRVTPFPRRWNVAPQSDVPVVHDTREGERVSTLMRWGLVPHWAKDASGGARLNNARLETASDKPSFRQAFRRRRCLIPASGFYEWSLRTGPDGKTYKQPWYFHPTDAPLFAFAGLFEAWRAPDAAPDAPWLLTCSILTRDANACMAPVHDRMPALVPQAHWDAWLARGQQDAGVALGLLPPVPAEAMACWPVSRQVSRAGNEGEALVAEIALDPPLL